MTARGGTQAEIAEHLGVDRTYVSRLIEYGETIGKLVPVGTNSAPPTERELRPFIDAAASEVGVGFG